MGIEYYDKRLGSPKISITNQTLGIYAATIDMMDTPEYVMLGYDPERRAVVIKPVDDNRDGRAFRIKDRVKGGGYVGINATGFIEFLKAKDSELKEALDQGEIIRCLATQDDNTQVIICRLEVESDGSSE